MSNHIHFTDFLDVSIGRLNPDLITPLFLRCRPRLLMVADGSLNFRDDSGFGLWRFLHAITSAAGVSIKPAITLAHRNNHPGSPDTTIVGADTYNIINFFNFASAATPVTLANYDQVWMFGINPGNFGLSNAEVAVLSEFMNGGGGVFATGDHASLGREMAGGLPRIRHMREWRDVASGGIPMGAETANTAVNRIDTVINPGANNLYEFSDQSDDIPQRIFPNYRVSPAGSGWQATVHPLLMMPGAPATRSSSAPGGANTGFTNDVDALPDHPHESVCYDVTSNPVLSGNYNVSGQNFEEFRPSASNPSQRIGAEIAAYAVSGGRSVQNGVWKPPVKPRMFGVVSAYDGRQAQAYAGKPQRPGRIVCDSTWHHYVSINLDGTGASPRNGLGTWSGGMPGTGNFTPSAALEKIYAYYRNIISWLQPANRIWCRLWLDLVALRYHPLLVEELVDAPRFKTWRDFTGLGKEAANLIALARGQQALADAITSALVSDAQTEMFGDLFTSGEPVNANIDQDELQHGILGGLLAMLATLMPDNDSKSAEKILAMGPEIYTEELSKEAQRLVRLGMEANVQRAEQMLNLAKRCLTTSGTKRTGKQTKPAMET